jgi:hypothetical protein
VWLFAPLFVLLIWLNLGKAAGPFNLQAIPLTSILVQETLWIVIGSLVGFGLFSVAEAVFRDRDVRIHDLVRLTPATDAAVLGGKFVANAAVSTGFLFVAAAVIAAYQWLAQSGPIEVAPLLDLYGAIAVPALCAALSLGLALATITESRNAAYTAMVAVLSLFAYGWFYDYGHWLYNVPALDLFAYSDSARFGLTMSTLLLQRVYVVALAGLVLWAAVFARARRDRAVAIASVSLWAPAIALSALAIAGGGTILWRIHHGQWSPTSIAQRADYERANKPWLPDVPQPLVTSVDLDVDLFPDRHAFELRGINILENHHSVPIQDIYVTVNPRLLTRGAVTLDDAVVEPAGPALLHFRTRHELPPHATVALTYHWQSEAPDGIPPSSERFTAFVHPKATLLTSMSSWEWLPIVGYSAEAELRRPADRRAYGLGPRHTGAATRADEQDDVPLAGFMGRSAPVDFHAVIRAPQQQRMVAVGRLIGTRQLGDRVEYEYRSERPVYMVSILGGQWAERRDDTNRVWYDPRHPFNANAILRTMTQARTLYSQMFRPYPYSDLTVVELPNLDIWGGMAFAGVIPLAENFAFLTQASARRVNANAFTVAHEVAHEWWGSSVWPADVPGAATLTEGLATYSAIVVIERMFGERRRQALFRDLEYYYLMNRLPGQEKPLADLDNRMGNSAMRYHRAGIVLYMLSRIVGPAKFDAILGDFCEQYAFSRAHPTFATLLELIETRAPESRRFIQEFIFDTAVPLLVYGDVSTREIGDGRWKTTFTVANRGKGHVDVDVAAVGPQGASVTMRIGVDSQASVPVSIDGTFRPATLELDPSVTILLQNRSQAIYRF